MSDQIPIFRFADQLKCSKLKKVSDMERTLGLSMAFEEQGYIEVKTDMMSHQDNTRECLKWCRENCYGDFYVLGGDENIYTNLSFWFTTPTLAIMFKLSCL